MSKYTTELRYLVESNFDLGLQDYPIYKEDHRETLNNKIIEHYNFREIGFETPSLFKKFLNRKMNEIMPFYNQMYESSDIQFNPLWNVEMHETFTHSITDEGTTITDGETVSNGTNNNDGSSTNITDIDKTSTVIETSSSELVAVGSDTPQSSITDDDIKLNKYATKTEHDKNTGTSNTSDIDSENSTITQTTSSDTTLHETTNINNEIINNNNRTETYTKLTEGSSAGLPYSDAIKQWRNIMVNIDMQIIEELEPLFMQLW